MNPQSKKNPMRRCVCLLMFLCLLSIKATPQPSSSSLSAFENALAKMEKFFKSLDTFVERQVTIEKHHKLVRDTEDLAKKLYQLEINKESFVKSLLTPRPDKVRIDRNITDLETNIKEIGDKIRALSFAFRQQDAAKGTEIEEELKSSLGQKEQLFESLKNAALGQNSDSESVRKQIKTEGANAVKIIKGSQLALLAYLKRLQSNPPQ